MYKVCLLDDQPFVRQGLREIIDWQALNCKIAAEWGTAVSAIQEIGQVKPDILISDIVMPGLDGLALMDMLNQSGHPVHVIFLTAHRNFEYAQRAIDLGAVDYLVKPTDPKEVIRAVMKCIKKLNEKRGANAPDEFEGQQAAADEKEREIVALLVHGNPPIKPVLTDQTLFYTVVAIRFDETALVMPMIQSSVDMLRRKLEQAHPAALFPAIDKIVAVFSAQEPEALMKQTIEYAEEIQFWHRQLLDTSVSVGISRAAQGASFLHQQYLESLQALEKAFYYGAGAVISYEPLQDGPEQEEGIENVDMAGYEQSLLDAIRLGDEENAVMLLEHAFRRFIAGKMSEHDIKFQIYKWIFYVFLHVPLEPQDKSEAEKQAQTILTASSLQEIKRILGSIVNLTLNYYKSDGKDAHELIVRQIEQYIEEHYHDPDTSLTVVAEHVHLSPNYVSRLIKRKLGQTFTERLNEYRMEQAKKLLQNPKNKSYWVAENVGIPDPRYFSQLFRKYTNVTPSEYKNKFDRSSSRSV